MDYQRRPRRATHWHPSAGVSAPFQASDLKECRGIPAPTRGGRHRYPTEGFQPLNSQGFSPGGGRGIPASAPESHALAPDGWGFSPMSSLGLDRVPRNTCVGPEKPPQVPTEGFQPLRSKGSEPVRSMRSEMKSWKCLGGRRKIPAAIPRDRRWYLRPGFGPRIGVRTCARFESPHMPHPSGFPPRKCRWRNACAWARSCACGRTRAGPHPGGTGAGRAQPMKCIA